MSYLRDPIPVPVWGAAEVNGLLQDPDSSGTPGMHQNFILLHRTTS